jgi:hypothetical protein
VPLGGVAAAPSVTRRALAKTTPVSPDTRQRVSRHLASVREARLAEWRAWRESARQPTQD